MKLFIVFAAIVATALAAPAAEQATLIINKPIIAIDPPHPEYVNPDAHAVVLRFDNNNIGVNGYSYGYETSNGIAAQEEARLVEVGTEEQSLAVQGEFSYPGPDGVLYSVTYTADRNGFQAHGSHLPGAQKILK